MARTGFHALRDLNNPWLVVLLSVSHGFNEFFSIIIPPLFPFFVPELGLEYTAATMLVVAFFLAYSVFQLPFGALADVYPQRRLLVWGMGLLAGGIAVVAVAPSFPWMLVGMFVAGVGGSTYHPTGMSLISDVEPSETQGRSMGIHGALGSVGSVTAPVLMVTVAEVFGWRAALLAGAALGLAFAVALSIGYGRLRDGASDADETTFAAAARSVAADAREFGGSRRFRRELLSPERLGMVALFVVVGGQVKSVQTFTPSFVTETATLGEAFGGTVLSVTMITATVASVTAGYLADTWSRRRFTAMCFLASAATVVGIVALPEGRVTYLVAFAVLGFTMYAAYPAINATVASRSTSDSSGSVFAIANTAGTLGSVVVPFALGVVADHAGLRTSFLYIAVVCALGVGVSVLAIDG